jgi:hypothetical protein
MRTEERKGRNARDNNFHYEFLFASAQKEGSNTLRVSRRRAKDEFSGLVRCDLESLS